jgi:hypothetical protein
MARVENLVTIINIINIRVIRNNIFISNSYKNNKTKTLYKSNLPKNIINIIKVIDKSYKYKINNKLILKRGIKDK